MPLNSGLSHWGTRLQQSACRLRSFLGLANGWVGRRLRSRAFRLITQNGTFDIGQDIDARRATILPPCGGYWTYFVKRELRRDNEHAEMPRLCNVYWMNTHATFFRNVRFRRKP